MKTAVLVLAGVVLALSLAYLSLVLSFAPVYPFHDKFRDVENGIELEPTANPPLFYPTHYGSTISNQTFVYDAPASFGAELEICRGDFSVYPSSMRVSGNSTINFTIVIRGNDIVHINGDNRFYILEGLEENFTPSSTTVEVILRLNNISQGTLLIPIWDRCNVVYVNVTVF
ncbi:MAG: hypothetical protein RXS23_04030 [Metallosphaera yellowstonensis]